MRNAVPGRNIARPAMRRHRDGLMLAAVLGAAFMCSAMAPTAWATVADDDLVDVSGLTQVSDGELDKARGGFSLGAWQIDFGLVIKTAINNVQVLTTTFNIPNVGQISDIQYKFLHDSTPPSGGQGAASQGSSSQDSISQGSTSQESATQSADIGTPPPADQGNPGTPQTQQVAGTGAAGGDPIPSSTPATPRLVDAGTPDEGSQANQLPASTFTVAEFANGVVISNGMGTEIIQQVTGGVLTQIVNQANGIEISHSTELNLFVNNFSQIVSQASARSAFESLALQSILNNPLLGQ